MAYAMVVVGASLGGLRAVQVILGALPKGFALPIALVLHRGAESDDQLPVYLRRDSLIAVEEAGDKLLIEPGRVYVAPADYHLLVEQGHFALSIDEEVRHARPSIDVLFESAADAYGRRLIGIILTGHGEDGAQGLAAVARRGGVTIVQEPDGAEASGLPRAALTAVTADYVLPLEAIGPFLVKLSRGDT